MKYSIFLFAAFLVPSTIQTEQTQEPQPEAVVVALDDEATFEYLPSVDVSVDSNDIKVVSCYDLDCVEQNY